jgi:hypothetical protein
MIHIEGNKKYIYRVLHALNEAIKIPIIWLSLFIEFAYVERPVARLHDHRVDQWLGYTIIG